MALHSQKFVKKYMRLVDHLVKDNNLCPSRSVAAIIVDVNHKIRGVGYNGPPTKTAHCYEQEYLTNIVKPLLTSAQKDSLRHAYKSVEKALKSCTEQRQCPRKFLGYKSGERLDICSCQHAESNAIINAACDVTDCIMYCSLVPCMNCAGMIMNSRIAELHFPADLTYQEQTLLLLKNSKVSCYMGSVKI